MLTLRCWRACETWSSAWYAGLGIVAAALRRHNAHLNEAFDMMGFTYQAGE